MSGRSGLWLCFSVLLLAVLGPAPAVAMKHDLLIHDDIRALFKIETFGFENQGVIDLKVENMKISNFHASAVRAGFVLRKASSESNAQSDLEEIMEKDMCIFDELNDADDFSFEITQDDWKLFEKKIVIESGEEGMYSVVFARCPPELHRKVTFELEGDIYNPGPNYLSAGERPLPLLYLAFFFAFLGATVLWIYLLKQPAQIGGKVHAIHYLMLLVLGLKLGCLFCESVRYHMLAEAGAPGFWSMLFYVLSTLKGVLLFTVIMLIGSGWSLVKSTLNDKEKRIILVVLTLQVLDHIALIVLEETAPGSQTWLSWRDLLHLVDIICCCAILFPIIWSIKKLREAAESGDGRVALKNIERLQLFRSFYVVVVVYIYMTRIVVFLVSATVPFNMLWFGTFMTEAATLGFYVFTGYKFRPTPDSILYSEVGESDTGDSEYGLDAAMTRTGDQDPDIEMRPLMQA